MSVTAYHFWSPTCVPCNVIKPAVDDLKDEFSNVGWMSVNIQDDSDNHAQRFGVQVVPTIVVVAVSPDRQVLYQEKHSGTQMAQYYRILRSGLRAIQ